ncbi:MAG: hypothetical protein K9N51_13015, partial [Candidatus Pacebacteria bacterium]|nr:hypothetical protein [Candidatus Paceibacterota bacterium]
MKKHLALLATAFALVFFAAVTARAATFIQKSAGTYDWTNTANWLDGIAPAATETTRVYFPHHRPASGGEPRTVELNRSNQVLQGGLDLAYGNGGIADSTGEAGLTLDLTTYTLKIDGSSVQCFNNFDNAGQVGIPTVTITNGTFQLGDNNAASITIGSRLIRRAELYFTSSATLDSKNVSSVYIAAGGDTRFYNYNPTWDLSDATLKSGTTSNALVIGDDLNIGLSSTDNYYTSTTRSGSLLLPSSIEVLSVGQDLILGQTTGSSHQSVGTIDFGGSASLDLSIARNLYLGYGGEGTANLTNMPDDMDLTVGSDTVRGGNIYIGYKDRVTYNAGLSQYAQGDLTTPGGTVNAWVQDVSIGRNTADTSGLTGEAGTPGASGTLDLSASTLGTLDASGGIYVGVGENATGVMRLSGGTVTADSVTVGDSDSGSGELELLGTDVSIASSLTVGDGDLISIVMDGASGGIDLAFSEAGTLDISGTIDVDFANALADFVWSVRMPGDHETLFNS